MIPNKELGNGLLIPAQGFGTYNIPERMLEAAIQSAFEAGCTLIDTASAYGNEHLIGNAIKTLQKKKVLTREDLFIETKVGDRIDKKGCPIGFYFYNSSSCPNHDTKKVVYEQVENSLKLLNTDYLDLVMIHWPYYDVLNEIWSALEELYEQKVIRSIGVSNCKKRHIERIMRTAHVIPMVNQINVSPINTHEDDMKFFKDNNILVEAYSPMNVLQNKTFKTKHFDLFELADKYGKTMQQVILRWYYQKGVIPLPKSKTPARIAQNYDIYNFEISPEDISRLDATNFNYQYLTESLYCPGY
jgi:diketogulonate reductase-like aldo/keto reductase